MKYFILLLTIFFFSCNNDETPDAKDDSSPVRYDGLYSSGARENENTGDKYTSYLRFYEDGTVISVSTSGTAKQIKEWFKKGHENVSKGKYTIEGKNISFSTVLKDVEVEYSGKIIDKETLELHTKSLSNNNEADITFSFVE